MSDWDAKTLGGSIKRGIVNPDLQQERDACAFDKNELEEFIFGETLLKYLKEKYEAFMADPNMRLPDNHYELNRIESMEAWFKVFYHIMQHKDGKYFKDNLIWYESDQI